MKTKILLWTVVSLLIIGIAAGAFWWLRRPQVITFSDDSKLTLLGVDYGKRHVPPTIRMSGTPTNRAPARRGGSFNTASNTLVVWVRQEYDSQQYHYFQYFAYDKAGTACVASSTTHFGNGGRRGNDIVGIEFAAFPRRQGKFYVRAEENGNGGQEIAEQKFAVSNPARGSFATWTPESLPATKEDDDLSVTLTKLAAGADMPYQRNQDDPDDAMNKGVQAVFHVERNGQPVTNWQPVAIVTSDATGNHVNGWVNQNSWQEDNDAVTYQYGLWPGEPAWQVRLEFSQQSDFSPAELWTVQNIPVQPGRQRDFMNYGGRRQSPTNAPFAEADLNGFHLKIFPAKQFTDISPNQQPQGGLLIQTEPALAEGMRLTIAKLTDDQTNDVGFWENSWNPNPNLTLHQCQLRDIYGVTNLNLTLALHKSRFVEFTVKPAKQ
jgi:hypothetical protein